MCGVQRHVLSRQADESHKNEALFKRDLRRAKDDDGEENGGLCLSVCDSNLIVSMIVMKIQCCENRHKLSVVQLRQKGWCRQKARHPTTMTAEKISIYLLYTWNKYIRKRQVLSLMYVWFYGFISPAIICDCVWRYTQETCSFSSRSSVPRHSKCI